MEIYELLPSLWPSIEPLPAYFLVNIGFRFLPQAQSGIW